MRERSAAEREQHIQARLERHRNPSGPFDWHPVGKDWVRVSETRLADGSTAVILAYVGAIKRREEEVAVKTRMLQAMFDTMAPPAAPPIAPPSTLPQPSSPQVSPSA